MERKQLTIILFALLATSCIKKYMYTVKLPCNKLYVEGFNINPAGVDEDYLTDSITFRVFVGKFDEEHETFKYLCDDDSIKIKRLVEDSIGRMQVADTATLSITHLIKIKHIATSHCLNLNES